MKQRTVFLLLVSVFMFGLAEPAAAESRFGFKLGGGMGYFGGGDVNDGLQGMTDFFKAMFGSLPGSRFLGGYEPYRWGMDVSAELIYRFDPKFALGLGAGYLSSSEESTFTITQGSDSLTLYSHPRVKAVPITLNAHFALPAGGRLRFVLTAGAGLYLTSLDLDLGISSSMDRMNLSSSGFGAHGGLGLEIDLSPNMSLTADILGRFVSVGGLKGESTVSGVTESDGELWYLEVLSPAGVFAIVVYNEGVPTGAPISEVREARLGLNGFSVKLGILIRL